MGTLRVGCGRSALSGYINEGEPHDDDDRARWPHRPVGVRRGLFEVLLGEAGRIGSGIQTERATLPAASDKGRLPKLYAGGGMGADQELAPAGGRIPRLSRRTWVGVSSRGACRLVANPRKPIGRPSPARAGSVHVHAGRPCAEDRSHAVGHLSPRACGAGPGKRDFAVVSCLPRVARVAARMSLDARAGG